MKYNESDILQEIKEFDKRDEIFEEMDYWFRSIKNPVKEILKLKKLKEIKNNLIEKKDLVENISQFGLVGVDKDGKISENTQPNNQYPLFLKWAIMSPKKIHRILAYEMSEIEKKKDVKFNIILKILFKSKFDIDHLSLYLDQTDIIPACQYLIYFIIKNSTKFFQFGLEIIRRNMKLFPSFKKSLIYYSFSEKETFGISAIYILRFIQTLKLLKEPNHEVLNEDLELKRAFFDFDGLNELKHLDEKDKNWLFVLAKYRINENRHNWFTIEHYLKLIKEMNYDKSIKLLTEFVQSEDTYFRTIIAEMLENFNDEAAIDSLYYLLLDEDQTVRLTAATSLSNKMPLLYENYEPMQILIKIGEEFPLKLLKICNSEDRLYRAQRAWTRLNYNFNTIQRIHFIKDKDLLYYYIKEMEKGGCFAEFSSYKVLLLEAKARLPNFFIMIDLMLNKYKELTQKMLKSKNKNNLTQNIEKLGDYKEYLVKLRNDLEKELEIKQDDGISLLL